MGQNETSVDSPTCQDNPKSHSVALVDISNKTNPDAANNELENIKYPSEIPDENPICRICHCSSEDVEQGCLSQSESKKKNKKNSLKNSTSKFDINDPFFLITPCFCTGTLQYVHHKCLQQWIRSSNHKYCELCKYNFKLKTKNKPLYKWECLNMSNGERRKLLFHLAFNLISMVCVFWSIYVIAERATQELNGQLGWRFWIKMLVVTIGFVCGIMFIFFQLKLYVSIILRWKQYNQIIIIENVNNHKPMSKHENKPLASTIDMACLETKP